MQHETVVLTVRKSKKISALLLLLGITVALTIIALGLISTSRERIGWTTGTAILIVALVVPTKYEGHSKVPR